MSSEAKQELKCCGECYEAPCDCHTQNFVLLNAVKAERDSLRAQRDAAVAMLKRLEFSHGPGGLAREPSGKCPVCLGWDGSPKGLGETRLRHTPDCELAALLRAKGEGQ